MQIVKTSLVLLVASLLSTAAQAQAKLIVKNIAPRVGDEILIQVLFDTPTTSTEKEKSFFTDDYLIKSEIKINKQITQAGSMWVGPFTFKIDGKELITDSVLIEVEEALPVQKNQIIVRQVVYQQKQYVVVEQFLPNKKDDKTKYAALNLNPLENAGLSLTEKQNYTTSSTKADSYVRFSQTIYEVKKEADFSGTYTLTANSFNNFPADVNFQSFEIK